MHLVIPAPITLAVGRSRIADLLSIAGALLLVVLIMVGAHYATRWYARRSGPAYGGRHIRVVDRAITGSGSSILVVCVDGRYLLLGVSDKDIRLLCELEDFSEEQPTPAPDDAFGNLLGSLMNRWKSDRPEQSDGEDGDRS